MTNFHKALKKHEYGSEADTEELLRIGAMPEPLRLAAMLEKTMQWPLHGIAADCLRRMHNEANSCLLTAAPDLLAALIKTAALIHPDLPEYKAAHAAISKALGEK